MVRITRKENGEVVFKVSGQLNTKNVGEMKALIAAEAKVSRIALDLKDLTSVDAEAVKFLEKCEADAIELKECVANTSESGLGENVRIENLGRVRSRFGRQLLQHTSVKSTGTVTNARAIPPNRGPRLHHSPVD